MIYYFTTIAIIIAVSVISAYRVKCELPYSLYERVKQLIEHCKASIFCEEFDEIVTIILDLPVLQYDLFTRTLANCSAGTIVTQKLQDTVILYPISLSDSVSSLTK
jgi:putative IMPACT (imprinted ancient) family translation regulator